MATITPARGLLQSPRERTIAASAIPNNESTLSLPAIPDEDDRAELPLGVSASVLLTSLPRDTAGALDKANSPDKTKVTVLFKHIGSAPILPKPRAKIAASARFEKVASFLRKQLDLPPEESLFLYINSQFAPSGDEEVGNLFRCFKVDNDLVVNYCKSIAYG